LSNQCLVFSILYLSAMVPSLPLPHVAAFSFNTYIRTQQTASAQLGELKTCESPT